LKKILPVLFLLICILFSGCGFRADPQLLDYAPDASRRLVVYTSHKEEVYGPIIEEFEERTGIWVDLVTGGTGDLLARIEKEKSAPAADVMFGGGVESLLSYAGCFEPYTVSGADRLMPGLRQRDDICTPFSSLPFVIIYNTRLVRPDEITGWADLLDAQWKGRIAFADPSVSGSSYSAVMTMLTALGGDRWEVLERFYANLDSVILEDSGDVASKVDSGALSLGITLEQTALKSMAQGANIGIVYPAEGTSILPDGSALVAGAPHRDNAVAFLEFVLSADVQNQVVSSFSRRSVRIDVADREGLLPADRIPLVEYVIEEASAVKEEFLRRWEALGKEG
jgi:iron(III) transport system substrate-binding protein